MNLVQAIYKAASELFDSSHCKSYLATQNFTNMPKDQQKLIDQLIKTLLGVSLTDLISQCDDDAPQPHTRIILITWSLEHVKSVRPDLTDEQASNILEILYHCHDESFGINWDTVKTHCDDEYPLDELEI